MYVHTSFESGYQHFTQALKSKIPFDLLIICRCRNMRDFDLCLIDYSDMMNKPNFGRTSVTSWC